MEWKQPDKIKVEIESMVDTSKMTFGSLLEDANITLQSITRQFEINTSRLE